MKLIYLGFRKRLPSLCPAASARDGSVMMEFVMILGVVVVPVTAFLLAELNGGGAGMLHALRTFLARILVVIGLPLL